MKRLVSLVIALSLVFGWVAPLPVYAVDVIDPVCQNADPHNLPDVCEENDPSQTIDDNAIVGPNGILTKAVQTIVYITGLASVLLVVIGGLKYVLSTGDPNSTQSAKNTILYAMIGVGIATVAQVLVLFVLNRIHP